MKKSRSNLNFECLFIIPPKIVDFSGLWTSFLDWYLLQEDCYISRPDHRVLGQQIADLRGAPPTPPARHLQHVHNYYLNFTERHQLSRNLAIH